MGKMHPKYRQVTITYWEKQCTLMFQGKEENVIATNKCFLDHIGAPSGDNRTQASIEETPTKKSKRNERGQFELIKESNAREDTTTVVTRIQITQLHQFILNWEQSDETATSSLELCTNQDIFRESLIAMRTQRTIKNFKRDLLTYRNQRGLHRVNI